MVALEDLKYLTLYKKQFYLPIEMKDKKHNSMVMMLTPSFKSTIDNMKLPYTINKRYFESYYIEKSVGRLIQNESVYSVEDKGEYLFEANLSAEDKRRLPDSDFGIPELRKYPMPDKAHVLSAIKFFNYVEDQYEKELAKNIIKKIKEFDMASSVHVGKDNRFKPYWDKSGLSVNNESVAIDEEEIELIDEISFFNKFISDGVISSGNRKLAKNYEIVYTGYDKDINTVKKYINDDDITKSFSRILKSIPKKVNIIVTDSGDTPIEFTEDSVVVYTPKAFIEADGKYNYKDYIKYIIQLYAIYTLKPKNKIYYSGNDRVLSSIAEPAAILLSGIIDKELAKNKKDQFSVERVFKYIIEKTSLSNFIDIIASNNTKEILKYTKEYNKNTKLDEASSLILEEAEATPTVDNVPESIKAIQKMATTLKRRIRQHTVYKLNKLRRDMERGNVGKEARGYMNSLQMLQTGDLKDIDTAQSGNEIPDSNTEAFHIATGGDYLLEGNYVFLFEDSNKYNMQIRNALYKDRIRSNKQILEIYGKVKASNEMIKYTYLDIARYSNRNLFVDLSYYNETFFRNIDNLNASDKANNTTIFKIYLDLLERLLIDDRFSNYKKKTIFIPILDWRHNNSMRMWMYKEDINPVSAIYYMMKNNPSLLKKVFGDKDIVFLGAKNYFKMNFDNGTFRDNDVAKFLTLIKRIVSLGYDSPADPDPDDEQMTDSPKGIAMDIIDKIEKSQNVSITNVSAISNLKKTVDLVKTSNNIPDTAPEMAVKKDIVNVNPNKLSGDTKVVSTGATLKTTSLKTGASVNVPVEVKKKVVDTATAKADIGVKTDTVSVNTTTEEDKKNAIVKAVAQAADNSDSVDSALDNLDNDEFKKIITDLQNDSEENVRVSKTQASDVVNVQNEFHKKQVAGKSVKDLLSVDPAKQTLPVSNLKVASINKDWNNLTFMNFDKNYDPDSDIIKMLDTMQHWTFPIAVDSIDIKDHSSSEDILDLWEINCVDYKRTKFTLRVDIPKFINGSNFLKLRGNEKTLMIQSALLPIIKTGLAECQIIGSGGYNKIFVRRFGGRKGQSNPPANNLMRALGKYKKSDIKVTYGDNTKICNKYELPMDYVDLARVFNTIEMDRLKIFFNQDELRMQYDVDDTKGIPFAVYNEYSTDKKAIETILYYNGKQSPTMAGYMSSIVCQHSPEFEKLYQSIRVSGSRYTYSKASILNSQIPVIIICGYLEGLVNTMRKAGIKYEFVKEIPKEYKYSTEWDYIRFADGYLMYYVTYSSSLLLNGLKENDTESYSLRDANSRKMYYEFLDSYGNNLKNSDGIENSYDCMLDPIAKELLEKFKLPTDYIGVLIHANNILADNKYVKHIDQSGRRWRRKELIAGYFYKALTTSYQEYANLNRRTNRKNKMVIKQSAIIDLIVSKDPSTSDLSVNNALNDVECSNSVTNKGLVGMNVDRGYTINTRGYDDSMLNVLGMDTGFSGNVGINRQATINANVEGGRGFIKTIDNNTSKLSAASSFTMTEAVTPLGVTHDDPPRSLMTYIQTSKHTVRCDNNDPTLITTGADEAMPYMTSDIFAYKAKKDGKVIELVQEGFGKKNYIVLEYKDGTHEFINLSEEVKKNSDGGYYVPMKLDTDFVVGKSFKSGEIIAYDKLSFAKSIGESGNLAATCGTLAKVAIINTDEGFEDSAAITESFANKLGTSVIQGIETRLDSGSNVFINKEIGDSVMEGDTLFSYQEDFDDDVANVLLKNLSINSDQITDLGRTPVKCKYTGIVQDIVIYRTCELDMMSESLRKFVNKHERIHKETKSIYNKYGIDPSALPPTGKVPEIGRTKNLENGVLVIYYIKYGDKMSVGDKITFYSANKGIIKYIIAKEDEPYTDFRPTEHVDSFMSLSSISGRMTCSIPLFAATSKLMIELDRSVKDIAGIPYDVSKL